VYFEYFVVPQSGVLILHCYGPICSQAARIFAVAPERGIYPAGTAQIPAFQSSIHLSSANLARREHKSSLAIEHAA